MRNTDWKTVVLAGLFALVVVLVAGGDDRPAFGSSTDSNADMIAVTGEYGNGTSVLYVIDTRKRNIAVYRTHNGNGIELVGARRIEHDLRLVSFRDNTAEGFSPLELERNYLRFKGGADPQPIPAAEPPTVDPEKK